MAMKNSFLSSTQVYKLTDQSLERECPFHRRSIGHASKPSRKGDMPCSGCRFASPVRQIFNEDCSEIIDPFSIENKVEKLVRLVFADLRKLNL